MNLIVFGEILWDVFGDEKKIGGAPFNFAAHCRKLGMNVDIVSAVGNDELGNMAISTVKKLNLNTKYIQTVDYKTGHCLVTLHDGTPSYNLVENVAYDNIPMPENLCLDADAFYFGTLAQRNPKSKETLQNLLKGNYKEVFFDINIRQNYYSSELIDSSLHKTTILKVSREEIGVFGINGTPEEICDALSSKYNNLKLIIVTLDADGSFLYDAKSQNILYSPKPISKVVSTVGAGDSFSACFLSNYLNNLPQEECLKRATLLSDYVVTQLEAVPEYPEELKVKIVPQGNLIINKNSKS